MSPQKRSLPISLTLITLLAAALSGCNAHADQRSTTMRWSSETGTRMLRVVGSAEFTEDDRDVQAISPGGSVLIEDGSWLRPNRSYLVEADSSGTLRRTYKVAGREQSMDAAAQAWVAAAMLTVVRETALDAGPRVERILRKGGPVAVLREVAEIRSDGSKKRYLSELVGRSRLSDDELRDVMRSARAIGSDGDKTELLVDIWSAYSNPSVRGSWFTTLREVGSDGDKRRALEHAIRSDLDPDALALSASMAENIGSDGDKAAVLSSIAAAGLDTAVRRPWFRAVRSIGSDGDKARTLSAALVRNSAYDATSMVELLHAAQTIGSDGDKARVLIEAARSDMTSDAVQRAFFAAASTIGSDGDRKNVLNSVLRMPTLPPSVVAGVADLARGMGSDGDKASVLARVTEFPLDDAASRSAFFAAVSTVGSDGDKASVLLLAAERHASNPLVRASLEKALRSVHSDGEYRRVIEALRR